MNEHTKQDSSSVSRVGYLVNDGKPSSPKIVNMRTSSSTRIGHDASRPIRRADLDGNLARRRVPRGSAAYIIWDRSLAGFGLRCQPTGNVWLVRYRERGKQKVTLLGKCAALDAVTARAKARTILARIALDGLPKPASGKPVPLIRDYAPTFLADYAHRWKPATLTSSRAIIQRELVPQFGDLAVNALRRSDVLRWRDECVSRQGAYNRAVPVLSAMLVYAEQLGHCRAGSNPARGAPRYKRALLERYLTPREYRWLSERLQLKQHAHPLECAVIRLLIYTGARYSEILGLRWPWVEPGRLRLPDSKTGPKTVYLNTQAQAVLAAIPRRTDTDLVFANRAGTAPLRLDNFWHPFRRRASIPDVRIHDLRHSFASAAIANNVPLALIGALLGHKLHETTARYAHLADDTVGDAAKRVSGSLAAHIGLVT